MSKFFTIPEFNTLSQQQIFDMAVAHIGATRRKSVNHSGDGCLYGGTGCNAAPLLRPECRKEADEANDLDTDWHSLAQGGCVPKHESGFISALQKAHDDCENDPEKFMGQWRVKMRELASFYSLDTTQLYALFP